MAYYLNIESPVTHEGKEAFRLTAFSGHEEMSRIFRFTLDLQSNKKDIKPDEIVGKAVTFSVQDAKNQPRYFHGYVSRFLAGTGEIGPRRYQAEVVPWLWFLTRTADCRIFAKKSVPQILDQVFSELGFAVHDKKLSRSYEEWEHCVQYRETDFNFVSRLMEQEGIFYYFKHEKGKHTLVLGDSPNAYGKESRDVRYEYSFVGGEPRKESVTSWAHQYQFIPGKYALTDYKFDEHPPAAEKQPSKLLEGSTPNSANPKLFDPQKYELFDYPGEYEKKDEGKTYSKLAMEEEETAYNTVSGDSLAEFFTLGGKFKLVEHPVGMENGEYVITSLVHSAADSTEGRGTGQTYTNTFICMPATVPFRASRVTRKPAIHGVQTAVVVGPPGSEIYTDEYGRVKVQFFWDRYNTRMQPGGDEKKQAEPVWIRVGQIIAGKNWGAMFIPRVGQEVIVTFLEGDPDRPMITGMVYNKDQKPGYDPKTDATRSYVKTNTSPGGDGYNEIQFEDKQGKEMLFLHGQRNMDVRVRNDSLEQIGGNRHQTIGLDDDGNKSGSQYEEVLKDKHLKVHKDHVEHIGGDMKLLVGGIDGPGNQDIVIQADKKESIEGSSHLKVQRDRAEKIGGTHSLTIGKDHQEKVGMNHALEAGMEIHLKAGMKVVIEAGLQLTLKAAGGFVDIGPAGVTVQGVMVNINSGGAPGVGSGAQPSDPESAEKADPQAPEKPYNHKSGQKSTPY